MIHEIRVLPEYYGPIENGRLTFMVRPDNISYHAGDILRLREWDTPGTHFANLSDDGYTGRHMDVRVTYVMDPGQCRREADLVKEGHVILAIKRTGASRMKARNGYLNSISKWMDDILERRRNGRRDVEPIPGSHIRPQGDRAAGRRTVLRSR